MNALAAAIAADRTGVVIGVPPKGQIATRSSGWLGGGGSQVCEELVQKAGGACRFVDVACRLL